MTSLRLLLPAAFLWMQSGCFVDDGGTACTTEFRTVGIEVTGKTLDDWYTIRLSNNDTIRIGTQFENTYAVLDDNSQNLIAGREELFRFHGVIKDSIWVNEVITIKADECHIDYVSGNLKVSL
ncbi:MAG: hypothetical protein GC181_13480 [Bacteroidetes bacterium]|nr:hypothetical protein [Bacteroidota bacterium]